MSSVNAEAHERRRLTDQPDAHRLTDKVAIITGSAHGIGRAYARRLAAEGAKVVITDLDRAGAEAVVDEFQEIGMDALAAEVDIADAESVASMVSRVMSSCGKIDILVNNAAMFSVVPMSRTGLENLELDEWDRMMEVNLRGVWLTCKAITPIMRAQGYGKIVNISSGTAFKGSATRIHYVTSKAGIVGFTRSLARELGSDGITVNCVAPGSTLSEEDVTDEVVERRGERTADRCIKRIQYPEDLVGAVAFFVSADSNFVTGQTLVVDGGVVMP